jgi:hypothetical protein
MNHDEVQQALHAREVASDRRRRQALRGLQDCADRAALVVVRRRPFLSLAGVALVAGAVGRFVPRMALPPGLVGTGLRRGSSLAARHATGGML